MSTKILKLRSMRALVGIVSTLAWGLVLVSGASAHQFPVGCQGVGVSLGLAVFFGEGLCTGVPGNTCELTNPPQSDADCAAGETCTPQDATAEDLSPCETVIYQGRLAYFGAPRCGISDGVLGITLPNGTLVNVTPAGGIPLLASPGAFIDSNIVAYTVNPADLDPVTMQLTATITYLGVSHSSPSNGIASGSIDIFNGISPCPGATECRDSVCDPTAVDPQTGRVGLCVVGDAQDSTPCTDTDGNVCTEAGCEAGVCAQDHVLPNSKPCPDTGNECAAAGCDGAGQCDQLHTPVQDSTPCADTDGNTCTEAGCQAGVCDQNHVLPNSKPCADTGNECAAAGCDGAGQCDQAHTPVQDSTPCTDTDQNECTTAGCQAGLCEQDHIIQESTPCPDTDGDQCTMAGCNAAGMCDQGHIMNPDCKPPICHHPCPSNIKFDRRGSLDAFHLRIGFDLNFAPFDPTADGLKVTLSNANGVVWSGTLLPGDIIKTGRSWQYRDPTFSLRDGIRSMQTSMRGDGLWRLRVDAFDDFSAATLPDMTVTIEAAGHTISKTVPWSMLKEGWSVDFHKV